MPALDSRGSATRLPAELSPTGKLVYLYLSGREGASVEEMKRALGVPQLRLYPTLETLERHDLVDRTGKEFVAVD